MHVEYLNVPLFVIDALDCFGVIANDMVLPKELQGPREEVVKVRRHHQIGYRPFEQQVRETQVCVSDRLFLD